jgi:hypothetical protein
MPKHVGVKTDLELINNNIHYFCEHVLVFLQTVSAAYFVSAQLTEHLHFLVQRDCFSFL